MHNQFLKTPNTKLINYQYGTLLNIFALVINQSFNTSHNHEVGWERIKYNDLDLPSLYLTMNLTCYDLL